MFKVILVNFLNWTEDTFKLASTDVNCRFRDFLQENGVYVPIDKSSIASNLADIVNKEELPAWLLEELRKQQQRKIMNSRFDKRSPRHAEYFQPKSVSPPIVPVVQSKAEIQLATQMM